MLAGEDPAGGGLGGALGHAARIVNADLDHCSFSGLEYRAEASASRAIHAIAPVPFDEASRLTECGDSDSPPSRRA